MLRALPTLAIVIALAHGSLPAQSVPNRAISLAGDGSYAFAIPFGLNPNEISVEAWIRPSTPPPGSGAREMRIMQKGSETYQPPLLDGRFSLRYVESGLPGAGGTFRLVIYLGSFIPNDQVTLASGSPYPQDEWIHVTGTFSNVSGQASLYVNGILDNQTTVSDGGIPLLGLSMTSSPQPLCIGAAPFGPTTASFRGEIDEARLWTVERTWSQIAADFASSTPTGPGLFYTWSFEGSPAPTGSMGLVNGTASYPVSFVPAIGGGAFPYQAECQLNQASASLDISGTSGNASTPTFWNQLTGTINFASIASGFPWEIALVVGEYPVPLNMAGVQFQNGQILNINLLAPTLGFLNGGTFTTPFPGNHGVPFNLPANQPTLSGQMAVFDPAMPGGFALAAPFILAPTL